MPENDGKLLRRVNLMIGTVVSVLVLLGMFGSAFMWWVSEPIRAEARARAEADSEMVQAIRPKLAQIDVNTERMKHTNEVVEMMAAYTFSTDQEERRRIVRRFRSMQRVTN